MYLLDFQRSNNKLTLWEKKFFFYFRLCSTHNPLIKLFARYRYKKIRLKHGIEIDPNTQIGKGLYLGHPYNISINPHTIIGNNCNIHKGVVIGAENRGRREGTPTIGDNVWIGINAAVVGKISVGNDVLIAPNSYVNFDIPSHSVVYGNPGIIKHRDNATEGYINNCI